MMGKPREFWALPKDDFKNASKHGAESVMIKCVEHQAYEELKTHAEDLAEALEDAIYEFNFQTPNSHDAEQALASYRKAFPKGPSLEAQPCTVGEYNKAKEE